MSRRSSQKQQLYFNPITWVLNGLNPEDLRNDKPIPTSRYACYNLTSDKTLPEDWKQPSEFPPQFFSRYSKDDVYRMFCPASRTNEWSTLREMLPVKKQRRCGSPHDSEDSEEDEEKNSATKMCTHKKLLPSQCKGRHGLTYSEMTKYVDEQSRCNVLQRLF